VAAFIVVDASSTATIVGVDGKPPMLVTVDDAHPSAPTADASPTAESTFVDGSSTVTDVDGMPPVLVTFDGAPPPAPLADASVTTATTKMGQIGMTPLLDTVDGMPPCATPELDTSSSGKLLDQGLLQPTQHCVADVNT